MPENVPQKPPDNTYRLVLFDPIENPPPVRDLICGVTGLHPTDAMQWIARAPGVVRHPLAEGEIRELLDGLFDLGVPAEAWRIDAIPNLVPPRVVHALVLKTDGFQVKGLRGEPAHWVPWDKVELLAAGKIAQDDEQRSVTPPNWVQAVSLGLNAMLRRPQAVARRQRTMKLSRDPVGEAILVRRDPRIAFRIVENQMNYSCLGDRCQPSASNNFPILIQELRDYSTAAYITASTNALLTENDEEPEPPLFYSSNALIDYATLRLLWSWYRRDRDRAQGSPPPPDDQTPDPDTK